MVKVAGSQIKGISVRRGAQHKMPRKPQEWLGNDAPPIEGNRRERRMAQSIKIARKGV